MRDRYKILAEKYEMVTEIKEYYKIEAYGDSFFINVQKLLKNYPHLNEFAKWFINNAPDSIEIRDVIDHFASYIPAVKDYSDVDKIQVWADYTLRQASRRVRLSRNLSRNYEDDEKEFQELEKTVKKRIKDGLKEFIHLKAIKDAQQQHLSTHKVDISDF